MMKTVLSSILFWLVLSSASAVNAQSGRHILYGDVRVDEGKVSGLKPISLDIVLYSESGSIVGRLSLPSAGRYRFNDVATGFYALVVEVEGQEVARVRVDLSSPLIEDLRQDLFFEWKPTGPLSKPAIVSAADRYERSSANNLLFDQARDAIDKKHYNQASDLLHRIITADPKDFQARTELANVYFLQKNYADAENEYLHAIDARPGFFLALFSFGRLEIVMKKYDVAIEALTKALNVRPESPDANYFLGEAYLQIKKGSQAVGYLNEAIRLDPQGMAEVHLRLAALYHGAGMKDKAAVEYEAYLKKKPDCPDRKKLEQYIAANRKQ